MSAYARSAILLMTPSTFRRRNKGQKSTANAGDAARIDTMMESVKPYNNPASGSALASSFQWNSKTKVPRRMISRGPSKQQPPSSCIAFQDENFQLNTTSVQHPALSQLTMSQLSDAGRSFSQRSGSHIAGVDGNTSSNRYNAVGSRPVNCHTSASASHDHRAFGGLRYNQRPSVTSSTALTLSSMKSHSGNENVLEAQAGQIFFSQCSQLSDGDYNVTKRTSSSITSKHQLGSFEGDSRGTKRQSKPYNVQARSDTNGWRRSSMSHKVVAGSEYSPKNSTQGSSHAYPASQNSCISLLEQDSQQDYTEHFKSQPLLPIESDTAFVSRRPSSADYHTQQLLANKSTTNMSSIKKRSWMEACMDVITTPYRRNKKKIKKKTGILDAASVGSNIVEEKQMDPNDNSEHLKKCAQATVPCHQNANTATSLASQVLTVFQTPARSKNSKQGNEKNTPVPIRVDQNREKVTPSPNNDASKTVTNAQTLSEIQQERASLENVISRAKTLEKGLSDKLDLLKTEESNLILSLENRGEKERDSIRLEGGQVMKEMIQKGDDKMKHQLENGKFSKGNDEELHRESTNGSVEDRPREDTAAVRITRKKSTNDHVCQRNYAKAPVKSVEVNSATNDLDVSPLSIKSFPKNSCGHSDSNGVTQKIIEATDDDDNVHEEGSQVLSTDRCTTIPAQNSNSAAAKSKTEIDAIAQSRSKTASTLNLARTDSVPTWKRKDQVNGIPLRPRMAKSYPFKDTQTPVETPTEATTTGSQFNSSVNFQEEKSKMPAAIPSPDNCTPKMLVRKSILSDPPKANGRRRKRIYQRLGTRNAKSDEEYNFTSKRVLLGTLSISNLAIDDKQQSTIDSPPLFTKSLYKNEMLDSDKVISAPQMPDFEDFSRNRTKRKALSMRTRPISYSDIDSSRGEDVFEFR
eukprot:CAMPEP_0176476728 /NCGR_PEP_ID=MMETSP0200_2-20121128/217_1 /TAXON_ID=947934 /ORGANISM="Chaetoceros sp., Strain GSL56" /LENGTH=917 /DNA_ID=CAMNT_0017872437 /DNA_START=2086 /DNA_END=4841 /DNA_ORIENTATION=-